MFSKKNIIVGWKNLSSNKSEKKLKNKKKFKSLKEISEEYIIKIFNKIKDDIWSICIATDKKSGKKWILNTHFLKHKNFYGNVKNFNGPLWIYKTKNSLEYDWINYPKSSKHKLYFTHTMYNTKNKPNYFSLRLGYETQRKQDGKWKLSSCTSFDRKIFSFFESWIDPKTGELIVQDSITEKLDEQQGIKISIF